MSHDRKALIREYKNAPRQAGIAVIRNTASGRVLLLAGRDIPALLNRHRAQLRFGAHRNAELQRDWATQGEQAFAVEIVDTLAPKDTPDYDPGDDLRALEALWLEKLTPFGEMGYNSPPKP
jgi:hypothetical protein